MDNSSKPRPVSSSVNRPGFAESLKRLNELPADDPAGCFAPFLSAFGSVCLGMSSRIPVAFRRLTSVNSCRSGQCQGMHGYV
jgi:hypothetical protein